MAIINNFDSQYGGNRRSEAYGNLVTIFGEYSDFSFFSSFSNTNPLFDSVGICLHALGMPFREVSFAEPPSNRLLNFDVDFVSPSCILPTREWR